MDAANEATSTFVGLKGFASTTELTKQQIRAMQRADIAIDGNFASYVTQSILTARDCFAIGFVHC